MKKALALLLCALMLCSVAIADDYSSYSLEELAQKRTELLTELSAITSAYGVKTKADQLEASSEDSLGSIASLFPDEQLALFVRDSLNKFSISQPVTQAELDTIKEGRFGSGGFESGYMPVDFSGLEHLRYLEYFGLSSRKDIAHVPDVVCELTHLKTLSIELTDVKSLPENIGNLKELRTIYGSYSDLTELPASFSGLTSLTFLQLCYVPFTTFPEDIGNLMSLETIHVDGSSLKALPDSICNITSLKKLKIADTDVSSLPENIGNLVNLETLDISNTKISVLPDSIWGLTLKDLNMQGTSIK